jgi:hypothetical protein
LEKKLLENQKHQIKANNKANQIPKNNRKRVKMKRIPVKMRKKMKTKIRI